MNISGIIEVIKEFFLDILGFLIPGFSLILLIYFSLDFNWGYFLLEIKDSYLVVIFICISYSLGYAIYGLGMLRDEFLKLIRIRGFRELLMKYPLGKFFAIQLPNDVEDSFSKDEQVIACRKIFETHYIGKMGMNYMTHDTWEKMDIRGLRGIAMSYSPESDKKIYTFMLKSELCNYLSVVCYLISLLGIFSWLIFELCNFKSYFFISQQYLNGYFILFFCGWFFHKTRMRFYVIALIIPFSILLAKHFKI